MATEDKIMSLQACTYKDLPNYTKVFNLNTIEYHLWIYLNPEDVRDTAFLGAEEIGPGADNSQLFTDTFKRESQCWIQVKTNFLNKKIGKHTYKLSFVNRWTDTDFSLYVSYYIQNSDPEKPYVYMKDDGASTPVSNIAPSRFTIYER